MRKIFALLFLCLIATAAHAEKPTGDMFADQGFYVDERPLGMNAEAFHRNDMFKRTQPYATVDKDMFSHAKPPYDFGSQDMFAGTPRKMDEPYEPIFKGVENKE